MAKRKAEGAAKNEEVFDIALEDSLQFPSDLNQILVFDSILFRETRDRSDHIWRLWLSPPRPEHGGHTFVVWGEKNGQSERPPFLLHLKKLSGNIYRLKVICNQPALKNYFDSLAATMKARWAPQINPPRDGSPDRPNYVGWAVNEVRSRKKRGETWTDSLKELEAVYGIKFGARHCVRYWSAWKEGCSRLMSENMSDN